MNILRRTILNKARQLRGLAFIDYIELRKWFLENSFSQKEIELPYTITNDEPVKLKTHVSLKPVNNGKPYLYILGDVDALVYVNGRPYHGLDRWSRKIALPLDKDFDLEINLAPTRVFGEREKPPIIQDVFIVYLNEKLYRFIDKIIWLLELADIFDNELREEIYNVAWKSLRKIPAYTPSPKQLYMLAKLERLDDFPMLYDELLRYTREKPDELVDAGFYGVDYGEIDKYVVEADKYLEEKLGELRRKYGKQGVLHAVAHAHIDAAWLWSYSETIWKIARTYLKASRIIESYDKPVYVFSSAQYLEWLRDNYPEIYGLVRKCFRDNRIVPVGGMWVESDVLITPSESLARQLLYGQRFFERELGRRCEIGWLPDSFGYSGSLPQLLREAGLKLFIFHKTEWNRYNRFPYHTFKWRGIDGSTIYAHVLIGTYNHDASARSLYNVWCSYHEKNIVSKAIYSYGYGDGGGGPTEDMIEKLLFYGEKTPYTPSIVHGGFNEFLDELKKHDEELPVWHGEIYVEIHRGTYTTNTRIKDLVWRFDYLLRLAETLSIYDLVFNNGEYPGEALSRAWKTLLLSEFHDILPGTAVYSAYKEIYEAIEREIREIKRIIDKKIKGLISGSGSYVLFNPLQWSRTELIEIGVDELRNANGNLQVTNNSKALVLVRVPGLSIVTVDKYILEEHMQTQDSVNVVLEGNNIALENRYLRVIVDSNGFIRSIYDKEVEREVLEKPSNTITVYEDIPHAWDAWDIDENVLSEGSMLKAINVEVVEKGPLRACVKTTYRFRRSTITIYMYMYSFTRRIDFKVKADIHDRRVLVKTWFYPKVNAVKAVYDTQFGVIERPTHRNTSWEQARFEVPMLSWVAVEEHGYGFAVISPVKHGVSTYFNSIGLSLVKTPIYPNPLSDYGEIEFTYSIIPYQGTWYDAGIHVEAKKITNPLYIVKNLNRANGDKSKAGFKPLVVVEKGNLVIESIKKAEDRDTIILRLYEPCNHRGRAVLRFAKPVKKAWRTNILEDRVKELKVESNRVFYDYRPFEIVTIEVLF